MRVALILFLTAAAWAGQSIVTPPNDATRGSLTIPNESQYTNMPRSRFEIRFTQVQPCPNDSFNINYAVNFIDIKLADNGSMYSLGCVAQGTWGIRSTFGFDGSNPKWVLPTAQATDQTDLTFRMQRNSLSGLYHVEVFAPGNVLLASTEWAHAGSYQSPGFLAGARDMFRGGGNVNIAWARLYDTMVPVGSPMPPDHVADEDRGNLFHCEFEGTPLGCVRRDAGGNWVPMTLTWSTIDGADFVASGTHDDVISFVHTDVAGTVTLKNTSFDFEDGARDASLKKTAWAFVSGPTTATFRTPNADTTIVDGIVAGSYTFRMTVDPGGPLQASVERTVSFHAVEESGYTLFPTNRVKRVKVPMPFNPSAVGAARVRYTPKSAFGAGVDYPSVLCTAVIGCELVQIDPRLSQIRVLREYLDASNNPIPGLPAEYIVVNLKGLPVEWKPRSSMFQFGKFASGVNIPQPYKTFGNWSGERFMWYNWSDVMAPYRKPGDVQTIYIDQSSLYESDLPALITVAHAEGFEYERAFPHMNQNYLNGASCNSGTGPGGSCVTAGMEKFDYTGDYLNSENGGVQLCNANATSCVDHSTAAFNATINDVVFGASATELYTAHMDPYAVFDVIVETAGSGCTLAVEMYNGTAWAAATITSDPTSSLSNAAPGTLQRIRFTPPSWWQRHRVGNMAGDRWLARMRLSGCSTWPQLSKVQTDNWRAKTPGPARSVFLGPTTYIGGTDTFNTIHFTRTNSFTPNQLSGHSLSYWNGSSWVAVSGVTNGTTNYSQTGTVTFTLPGSWVQNAPSTGLYAGFSGAKYYLRLTAGPVDGNLGPIHDISVSGGATGGTPVEAWIPAIGRGWCPDDPGVINTGLSGDQWGLMHNPDPPEGCDAEFPSQSRLSANWRDNGFTGNPLAEFGDNKRIWATQMFSRGMARINASGANTLFIDVPIQGFNVTTVPRLWTFYSEPQMERHDMWTSGMLELSNMLEAVGVPITPNEVYLPMCRELFSCWEEGEFTFTTQNSRQFMNWTLGEGGGYNESGHPNRIQNVWVNSAANTNGTMLLTTYTDNDPFTESGYPWDRGHRGPMLFLSLHYMVGGAKSVGLYTLDSGATYGFGPSIRYVEVEPSGVTTANITVDATTNVKTIELTNASIIPEATPTFVRIGTREFQVTRAVGASNVTTTDRIGGQIDAGANWWISVFKPAIYTTPWVPEERVLQYGNWFPGQGTDVGEPLGLFTRTRWNNTATGLPSGVEVYYREFENAIVMNAPTYANNPYSHFFIQSNELCVDPDLGKHATCDADGMMVYPLKTDGTTGPGTRKIRLYVNEGAVLMKHPIY